MRAFIDGLGEFENVETPESGLGPIFNNTSCAICHSNPAIGGSSALTVTRFGRMDKGVFDPLTELGGSLLQSHAIDPAALEHIPAEATIRRPHRPNHAALWRSGSHRGDHRQGRSRTSPSAKKADGVLGRAAMIVDVTTGEMRVGRFGWKAQQATLLANVRRRRLPQ